MKPIIILTLLTLFNAAPVAANRHIYLKTDNGDHQYPFAFENIKDSVYIHITPGYRNPEYGGWMLPLQILIKPTAPDGQYTIYVDGKEKQTGWLKNGLYNGDLWQPEPNGQGWKTLHFEGGKKQGPQKTFLYDSKTAKHYLYNFEWYDNDRHAIETLFYPSGVVEHYSILHHLFITIGEDNTIATISEGGGDWRTLDLEMSKGQLDGQSQWMKGGNGNGTEWLRITFKQNQIISWEQQVAVSQDSMAVVAKYRLEEE